MRRGFEYLLLLVGILAVGVWAWATIGGAAYQSWQNWTFEHALRGEGGTLMQFLAEKKDGALNALRELLGGKPKPASPDSRPPEEATIHLPNGGPVGRLEIPRLKVRTIVREGTGESTLSLALGHIPGTAFPGQKGNVGVAGHRDTLFRKLAHIDKRDVIVFETLTGRYTYQVETTSIVKPTDVHVLNKGKYPQLTLVTCYPFRYIGSAPDRFIVKAKLVSESHPNQTAVEAKHEPVKEKRTVAAARQPARPSLREAASKPRVQRVSFQLDARQSQQLIPGISVGISETNVYSRNVDGWLWLMPERKTIWLRNQAQAEPIVFYTRKGGGRHELVITKVTRTSASGYLLVYGGESNTTVSALRR